MINRPRPSPDHTSTTKPTRLNQTQRRANDSQTFSHLLGFTLPPRSNQAHQSSSSSFSRRPVRKQHVHNSFHDKDRFVHAKYRFILKPTGDYTVHFADPDIRFNWSEILQVIVNVSSALPGATANSQSSDFDAEKPNDKHACPVCLSEPAAARITKCGHIFCYPCILHYLELSDEAKGQGRKCPVCWETVMKKDLKSVKWFDCRAWHTELTTFRLIERPNLTTLALPRSSTWPSTAVPSHHSPWEFTPDALNFANFIIASPGYMMSELSEELLELRNELALLSKWSTSQDECDELGVVFIRAAEVKIKEQMEKVSLLKTTFVMTERKKALRSVEEVIEQTRVISEQTGRLASSTTDHDESSACPSTASTLIAPEGDLPAYLPNQREYILATACDVSPSMKLEESKPLDSHFIKPDAVSQITPKARKNLNPPEPTSTTYRFYQAASGERIFLSSLDVRVLLARFGSFDCFPEYLTLKVEACTEARVSDELRRRYRYLSHLPTGSEIRMAEVNLDEYLVNDCSLVEAVRKRRAKRREKIKREDKAKTKSEAIEKPNWNASVAKSIPEWDGPAVVKTNDKQTGGQAEAFSQEPVVLGNAQVGPQMPIQSGGEPSGSRTVWGTYIPSRDPGESNQQGEADEADDVWASHEARIKGLNKSRRGARTQLNVQDIDESDNDQERDESRKKKAADGTRKKGKEKNRKHVNKIVINLSGGTGGRRS